MSAVDDILSQLPISSIAQQLGVDEATADEAVRTAIPSLLGGLEANAADPAGAQSLSTALSQHDNDLLTGGVNLDQVDTGDGAAIVQHVFGNNTDQVYSALGGAPGAGNSSLFSKLLPILAPIVMSYLAKQLSNRMGGGSAQATPAGQGGGDILQQVLSSVLSGGASGGGTQQGQQSGSGSVITDILGGLLGQGRRA